MTTARSSANCHALIDLKFLAIGFLLSLASWVLRPFRKGKTQADGGAQAPLAVDGDAPAVPLDDAVRNRQAQPGAQWFRRVEGIEDARQVLRLGARAGVGDDSLEMPVGAGRLDGQPPRPVHRVQAVDQEIQKDLPPLYGIRRDGIAPVAVAGYLILLPH